MPALMPPVVPEGGLRGHRQPVLAVDGLVLRPWEDADVVALVSAYGDPDIQRWHVRSMSEAEALDWVRTWPRQWAEESGAGWAVVEDGTVVGRVGFGALDLPAGAGKVAYWVVPAARGHGIAARALTAATDWMFEVAGFHRMALLHSTRNDASCRVAARAGYSLEGTARSAGWHADGWHDMHVHARVNPPR